MAGQGITLHVEGIDKALAQSRRLLDAMSGKDAATAVARALNRALAAGKTEATRIARRAYTAPSSKLFQQMSLKKAVGSTLEGELRLSSKPGVSLIHFKAIPNLPLQKGQKPRGVSVQVKRGGPRTIHEKAFIMRKKQGGFGAFVKRAVPKGAPGRFTMLMGPSPIQALQRRDDQERVQERIAEAFSHRLPHEIDALLAGLTRGGGR